MIVSRLGRLHRVFALALTWAVPGTTAWSLTPPALSPARAGAASAAVAIFAGHDDPEDDDAVLPILECVVQNSANSYTAHFGFKNETSQTVSIPVGAKNAFSPAPQDRGQPASFPKGRSPYYPNTAFSVPFSGSSLTWTLKGPDNHARAASASASSPRCQPSPTPTPTATPTPVPTPTPSATCANPILTARRFTRTSNHDDPTVYHQTFTLPAGSVGPYTLWVATRASTEDLVTASV